MASILKNDKNEGMGDVLRLLRIANEMTIKELALKVDVSATYICEIEANNKKPSLDLISKYSEVFGISRSTILYFDEERGKHNYTHQKLLLEILKKLVGDNEFKEQANEN